MIERLLAVAVLAASLVYLASAWALPLGTAARPGAGFYPLAVGVFGAVVVAAPGWRRRSARAATGSRRRHPRGRARARARHRRPPRGLLPRPALDGLSVAAFLFTGLLLRGLGGAAGPRRSSSALASALASYYALRHPLLGRARSPAASVLD